MRRLKIKANGKNVDYSVFNGKKLINDFIWDDGRVYLVIKKGSIIDSIEKGMQGIDVTFDISGIDPITFYDCILDVVTDENDNVIGLMDDSREIMVKL